MNFVRIEHWGSPSLEKELESLHLFFFIALKPCLCPGASRSIEGSKVLDPESDNRQLAHLGVSSQVIGLSLMATFC